MDAWLLDDQISVKTMKTGEEPMDVPVKLGVKQVIFCQFFHSNIFKSYFVK